MLAEVLMVAARRNIGEEVSRLIAGPGFEIVPVTSASARRMAQAYRQWGKGIHPAGVNWGGCFAYEVAATYPVWRLDPILVDLVRRRAIGSWAAASGERTLARTG